MMLVESCMSLVKLVGLSFRGSFGEPCVVFYRLFAFSLIVDSVTLFSLEYMCSM